MKNALNKFFTIGLVSSILVSLHMIYSIYNETLEEYLSLGDYLGPQQYEARYEKIYIISFVIMISTFLIIQLNKQNK